MNDKLICSEGKSDKKGAPLTQKPLRSLLQVCFPEIYEWWMCTIGHILMYWCNINTFKLVDLSNELEIGMNTTSDSVYVW